MCLRKADKASRHGGSFGILSCFRLRDVVCVLGPFRAWGKVPRLCHESPAIEVLSSVRAVTPPPPPPEFRDVDRSFWKYLVQD